MSLQVWLPLNGNLKNNGCDGGTVSSVNASTSTSGKIGSCYSFNGSSSYLLGTHSFLSNSTPDWSFACWMKLNSTSAGQCLFSCRTIIDQKGIAVFYYGSTWLIDDGVRWQFTPTVTIAANKWYHVCVVHKKDVGKYLYINGSLDSSTTTTSTPTVASTTNFTIGNSQTSSTVASGNPLNGYLNDVRIYDHALSIAEVKELAKGLVCHYKLDTIGLENLLAYSKVNDANKTLLKSNINSIWNNLSIVTIDGCQGYHYPSATGPTGWSSGWWYKGLEANTTYTYSAWIYFTASANFNFASLGHFQVYNSGSSASDKSHEDVAASRIYEPSTIPANKWTKVRITFTTNSLAGSYFQIYPRYNIAANRGDLYFRDCKLEKNSTPTSWVPNSADNEYKALGFDSTTIADNSGFGNNGTKTGTITNSSDAPRYSSSTNFNNSGHIINSAFNLKSNSFTVNLWVNPRTASAQHFLFGSFSTWPGNGLGVYRDAGSIKYQCLLRSDGESSYSKYSMTVTLNTWNMLTVTYSGTVYTGYINGVKSFEVTYGASGTVSHYNIMIGNSKFNNTPASENEEANVSDFRLYATCLSADDIKRLYEVSASVSKNNSMLGYEMKEG